ncbi:MAG: arsenite methyltransferase [Armatimonadetes bacterium]|nr:arsenite methyltransferase [Armatimonadota bacterium]
MAEANDIRESVRKFYAQAALSRKLSESCGGSGCCDGTASANDPIIRDLYAPDEVAQLPAEAVRASMGCGNPTALADLRPGETVLDLGSGGGIDVLLSARRVGPTGKAYGLDMTDEMLALARENQRQAGIENAEFLKGTIEAIPLPDRSVDVVISNCVINLSGDKDRVFCEAFRVLRPGGRFAVSDIVLRRQLPEAWANSLALWAGCTAGALLEDEYRARLAAAGFVDVTITPTRVYGQEDIAEAVRMYFGGGAEVDAAGLDGAVMSAFVRATRPSA